MATYKVIQNIEAEDKFLGPLTFKQFIFAAIAAICIYIGIYALLKGIVWVIVIMFFPATFAGFLAFPWGRDQTTETWLLGKIRYMVKPKLRIWNQAGQENLVTITAPKKVDKHLTKDLTQDQVKSRLKALASTIDSHGWAIKNVDMMPSIDYSDDTSDRLIHPSTLAREVPAVDVEATEDILDEGTNPLAKKLDGLMNASTETHHQQVLAELNNARNSSNANDAQKSNADWFMDSPDLTGLPDPASVSRGASTTSPAADMDAPLTNEEKALLKKIHDEEARLNPANAANLPAIKTTHEPLEDVTLKTPPPPAAPEPTINPEIAQSLAVPPPPPPPPTPPSVVPNQIESEKLRLATNNDRSVESIAREANAKPVVQNEDGEVIISLH